ncbi:MAG TPA: hypothetical protein PKM72_15275 [Nitrospirales bacterium]|nr:hypothetical protein [Nitrospirales bacterium]
MPLVLGGGIGERAPDIRTRMGEGIGWCGPSWDSPRNFEGSDVQAGEAIPIHRKESAIQFPVIGTDKESWVASETCQYLKNP